MMDKEKLKRLEAAGWKSGSAEEFLELSAAESALVELRLRLSDKLKQRRRVKGMSQAKFAESLKSSQSRVAKMEANDSTVSIDLLVRSLIGSGLTLQDISDVLKDERMTVR
jgi:ribosome-binding protein aMBF1 (putative translation factor)